MSLESPQPITDPKNRTILDGDEVSVNLIKLVKREREGIDQYFLRSQSSDR